MASTYSSDLKLELMATGENAGTWGTKTNTNLELVQQAIAGFESITLSSGSTTALVMSNASISTARNMVIKFATITLSGSTTVTIPDSIEKFYIFDCRLITNPTNLTIKTASGTGTRTGSAKASKSASASGTGKGSSATRSTKGSKAASSQIADVGGCKKLKTNYHLCTSFTTQFYQIVKSSHRSVIIHNFTNNSLRTAT